MAEEQEDQGGEKLKDPPKSYRSKVWSYYGFRDSRDLKEKATCRLCFSDITCKTGSTSSMTHHLKRKHGIDLVQDTDKTSDLTGLSSSSSKADCSKPLPSGQMTLTQFQLKKYTKSDPRKTNITKAIAGYLADDMRPYSTVQSDAFKYMIKVLDPRYELPSRTYFSEKVMPEIYQTVVARVKTQLDKAPSVAITTDSWTSRATENFVAVTAHFINKNWDVENYTLQTKKFSESHTSVNLATGLDDVVSEWKLFRGGCKPAITTDNAKNIVNAAKLADFNPHIPCFAHTLNLATQRGMKIPQMDRLLSRVRRVVSFFHKSTTATNHLKGMQSKLEIPEHKLLIDVQTRWNSSYEMLDRYLEQQAAIFATLVEMKKSVKDLVTLSDDDIRNVEDVIIVLKPLKTVTTMMCDSKHPTVSLIHPLKERLLKHLKPVDEDNQLMHAVKTAIYNDLLPRYTDTETLKFIHEASALDPRFKSLPYLEDQRRTEVHNSLTLKAVENNNVTFPTEPIELTCAPLNGQPTNYDIRCHIVNVIEEAPTFLHSRYDLNVSEATTKGTYLTKIIPSFSEPDHVQLDFDLMAIGGNDDVVLDMTPAPRSTTLVLMKMVDYDTGVYSYNMTLKATVRDMSNLTATTEIVVHVTDADDQNPTFTHNVYSCSVKENVAVHTTVTCDHAPFAYDQDRGLNQKVNYQMIGIIDHVNIPFIINSDSGNITINGTLDRENKDSYAFTIMANQVDKPLLRRATSLVYVQIVDVNDNSPVMSETTYDVSIPENLPDGTFVLKVGASDLDRGNNSLFGFKLLGSYSPFKINESGVITVRNASLLDREQTPTFTFEVQAFETATTEKRTSGKSSVKITLIDENDNSPEFNSSNKRVIYVNKTTPVDTSIAQVTAFDRDNGNYGKVTYAISSSDDSIRKFKIDPKTGDIKVAGPLMSKPTIDLSKGTADIVLELEKNSTWSYTFDVIASDNDQNERRQTAMTLKIDILDENVYPPFIVFPPAATTKFQISENFPINVTILKIEALDLDPKDIDSLVITVDPHPFKVIGGNLIVMIEKLDREKLSTYDLHVNVSDGKHHNVTTYKVEVQDENDNPPKFTMMMYNFSIAEESGNNYVGEVNATDSDIGTNAELDYAILPSLWSNNFTILSNGSIVTKSKIDREMMSDSAITLYVQAVDKGSPSLTGTTTVNVEVRNINDNAPVFLDNAETLYIVDELALKGNFCHMKAFDQDQDSILYDLTVNPYNTFKVDSNGYISVVAPIEIDKIKSSTLTFTIKARNKDPYSDPKLIDPERNITVLVKDVNNNGPVFTSSTYNYTVFEGVTGTFSDVCINSTDNDLDIAYTLVKYRIVSGDADEHLNIDSNTGCLQIVKAFDYEHLTTYSVEIEATDAKPWFQNNASVHNITTSVKINIKDKNDNKPKFSQDFYYCIVNESFSGLVSNCLIKAKDDDLSSSFNTLTYNLQEIKPNDSESRRIEINESTGQLNIKTKLDYEATTEYILTVGVSDRNFTSQCLVILAVLDENDNPPDFINLPPGGVVRIPEDTPVHDVIFVLEANDKDLGDVMTYSIYPNEAFTVDKSSGIITLWKTLNASAEDKYVLNVTVSDGLHTTTKQLTIEVLDVNDNPPIFEKLKYDITESEGNIVKVQVKAVDVDIKDSITYAILPGPWEKNFTIDNSTGEIKSTAHLDRESVGTYNDVITLDVKATDSTPPFRTGLTTVTIKVTDINDNLPYFTSDSYHIEVDEHTTNKTVLELKAKDDDIGNNSTTLFKMLSSSIKEVTISDDGKVRIDGPLLIKDKSSKSMLIDVEVSNPTPYKGAIAGKKVTQQINITIKDVNDYGPVFAKPTYNFSVDEDVTGNVFGECIKATDRDIDITNTMITYRIRSGNEDGHLYIDSSTGCLHILKVFDYENRTKYSIQIEATDAKPWYQNKTSVHNVTTTVNININDINDNAPKFDQDLYHCNVSESFSGLVANCPIKAKDKDVSSKFNNLTYDLQNVKPMDSGKIGINESTGQVNITSKLDYEVTKEYILTIGVTDGTFNSKCLVILTVCDENDNPPVFINLPQGGVIRVLEDTPVHDIIFVLEANDKDADDVLIYSVFPNDAFIVDKSSAIMRLADTLNASAVHNYNLNVSVSDGLHTTQKLLMIEVLDVNDNPPTFERGNYNITRAEGNNVNLQVQASDIDTNDNISYSILPGPWEKNFTIDNNTGEIKSSAKLDRESVGTNDDMITLDVIATDSTPPFRTGLTTVRIKVTDINDNLPYFTSDNYNIEVDEYTTNKTVLTLKAQDHDIGENSTTLFKMSSPTVKGVTITNDGKVRIDRPLLIGDNSSQSIIMGVEVYNPTPYKGRLHGSKVTQNIKLKIKDVNDHGPRFTSSIYNFTVTEGMTGNFSIECNIKAVDSDVDVSNKMVTYRIVSGDTDGHLYIDSNTGCLQIVKPFDYENLTEYSVQVEATDAKPWYQNNTSVHNVTATVYINISDVNDNVPNFHQDMYLCNISESLNGTIDKCRITAKDDDISPAYSNLKYSLQSVEPTASGVFEINDTTGFIEVTKNLDYESTKQYILTLQVSDGKFESNCRVVLMIEEENDNKPEFIHLPPHDALSVLEDTPVGNIIYFLIAEDGDVSDTLTYSLTPNSPFHINKTSGIIRLGKTLNASDNNIFNLTATVSDNLHATTTQLIIYVKDVNDNPPVFEKKHYNFSIQENTDFNKYVKAYDVDLNDNVTYSLLQGPWSTNFTIDSENGTITSPRLDREALGLDSDVITLYVKATDSTPPYRTGLTTVSITVMDVNDNLPYFSTRSIHLEVEELTVNKSDVIKLEAFDDDIGNNSKIIFEQSSDGVDGITVSSDGLVMIDKPLKIYNKSSQNINVEVVAFNPTPFVGDVHHKNHSQTLQITLKDVNNHVPLFTKSLYKFTIDETAKTGFLPNGTERISAEDDDIDDVNRYMIYDISGGNQDGMFGIDNNTGEIILLKKLNFETRRSYKLTVSVWNIAKFYNGSINLSSTSTVVIDVVDSNDEPPIFKKDVYTCEVPETEKKIPIPKCQVSATDMDISVAFRQLKYEIIEMSPDKKVFGINSTSGELSVTDDLDYDSVNEYMVKVNVTDSVASDTCTVIIHILNTNNHSPVFNKSSFIFNLTENEPVPAPLGIIEVSDQDGDILTLSVNDTDFEIDSTTGELFSLKAFDYETKKNIKVSVNVTDGQHSAETDVTVQIVNMNDNDPNFTSISYNTSVLENVTLANLTKVHAEDIDNLGQISYTILPNKNTDGLFVIDSKSGQISVNNTGSRLDYDTVSSYTLFVEANDGSTPARMTYTIVTIDIMDVNDVSPTFDTDVYRGDILENASVNSTILMVFAMDEDTKNQDLVFKVENSTMFHFRENTLENSMELDAETQKTYTLDISVFDGEAKDFALAVVTVTDVNDNDPKFDKPTFSATVSQLARPGQFVTSVSATDDDISNDGFTYFISSDVGYFVIDESSGNVTVSDNTNWKPNITYNMTVFVSDHGQPPRISNTTLAVFIDASNHFDPVFSKSYYVGSIFENSAVGTTVNMTAEINATDADGGKAGDVRYYIISGSDDKFEMDNKTGIVTLAENIDCEKQMEYKLNIIAKDLAKEPRSATAIVTISIENVNEAPRFSDVTQSVCLNPPIPANVTVVTVQATDDECRNKKSKLSYALQNGTSVFRIDPDSGIIYTKKNLSSVDYVLSINVIDEGGLGANRTVTLSAGNNGEPVIQPLVTSLAVTENQTASLPRMLTKINATSTSGGQISFSIANSSLTNHFVINNKTGELLVTKALDKEGNARNDIELVISASNNNGTCSSQVVIHVDDINDNPPVFTSLVPVSPVIIPEDTIVGTCVATLTATDRDFGGPPSLNFSIQHDQSGGKFSLSQFNGTKVCLNLNDVLDYESSKHLYDLEVSVTDGTFTSYENLTIKITDINDNAPKFLDSTYFFAIKENSPRSVSIGTLEASDADSVDKGKLTYAIIEGEKMEFILRNNSGIGELQVGGKLDREVKEWYNLTVAVYDSDMRNDTADVFVHVLDTNDNIPHFLEGDYVFNVSEGIDSVGKTFLLSAVDADLGENGNVFFNITNGNENNEFNITTLPNKMAIIYCIKELDREKDNVQRNFSTYDLTVLVTDEGSPRLSSSANVEVKVFDINDCEPKFDDSVFSATVMEGSPVGFSVFSITANDCDFDEEYKNLTFSLSGDSSDMFGISKYVEGSRQIGMVTLNKKISILEGLPEYVVNISVSDGLHSNYATLFVNVTDINDHDPIFINTIYNFTTPENDWKGATRPSVLGSVSATDKDIGRNGDVSYHIISSDVTNLFNISAKDGNISVIGALDRDSCLSNRYSFTVIATDNGVSQRAGYTEVIVFVSDVNDNHPEFTLSEYTGSVEEDSNVGTTVAIIPPIAATDIDNGINGTEGIRFSLLENDNTFIINYITGEITVNASNLLDTEQQQRKVIQVIASDRLGVGNLLLSKSVNVTITIINKNDETPSFLKPWYHFNISEAAKVSEIVGYVTAEDADVSNDTVLTYSIEDGAKGRFYMDKTTGEIRVGGGLDRETEEEYNLTVRVTDGLNVNYTHVTIVIEDVNDNAPKFHKSQITTDVMEGLNVSTSLRILQLIAEDKDAGINKEVSYFFNDTDLGGIFSVTENGSVFLHKPLDREKNDSYTFLVFAEDHGFPQFVTKATVHIIVKDINDNAPIFYDEDMKQLVDKTVTILEKSPTGVPVYIPHVEDQDVGENAMISYILDGHKSVIQYFAIDPQTGMVTVKKTVDVNTIQHDHIGIVKGNGSTSSVSAELDFLVVASDDGSPRLSSNITLTVLIDGINDDAPVFLQQFYNFSVKEGEAAGAMVGSVDAVVHNESNFLLHYSIINHFDAANYFDVLATSGNITTKQVLDREAVDKISFAVEVRDGRTPERTAYTVVEVVIKDMNDNPPVFDSQRWEYSVTENQNLSSHVYVMATDADIGLNGNISYEIVNQTHDNFQLDPWTGQFDLNYALDRENTSMYEIRVKAEDRGHPSKTSFTEVLIRVLDINDNAPVVWLDDPCTVEENLPPGQLICNITALDDDEGMNGTVTFSLMTSNDVANFFINPLSGSLYTTKSLDYEDQSVYNMTVIVSDLGNPSLTSTLEISITVLDMFDTIPQFRNESYLISIGSELSIGSSVINVDAIGRNVSYSIIRGDEDGFFTINPENGTIELKHPLTQSSEVIFLLQIMVQENSYSYLNSTSQVIINVVKPTITDVPVSGSYNVSIEENHSGVKVIYDVNTTVEFSGKNANYRIVKIVPTVNNTFQINSTSGVITCIRALDRETHSSYQLTIRYQEDKKRRKREVDDAFHEIVLVVGVTDVNDNIPKFANDTMVFGIPIGANPGDVVFTIEAEDPDEGTNAQLVYRMEHPSPQFYLDPNSGEIHTKSLLYRKNVDLSKPYFMDVTATDENGFGNTTSAKIIAIIIPDDHVVLMTVNRTVTDIIQRKHYYEKEMSHIMNVKVEFNKLSAYVQDDIANPKRTDIRLHAINFYTKLALQKDELEKLLTIHQIEIKDLFGPEISIRSIPRHHDYTLDQSQIALITIAVTIFVGTALAIFILQCSWKQSDEEEKEKELYEDANGNVDGFELESMHPSEHGELGMINPVYETTEADNVVSVVDDTNVDNTNTNTKIAPVTKEVRSQSFESQELTLNFLHDVLHDDELVTQSNGDSGVDENESNSSRSGSIQSVGSERPSANNDEDGIKRVGDATPTTSRAIFMKVSDLNTQDKVPLSSFIKIDMDSGDTDDDLSDDENNDNKFDENDSLQDTFPPKKSVSFSTEKIDIITDIISNTEGNAVDFDENEDNIEEDMVTSL